MPEPGQAARALAELGPALHARGWVPATSGNFSLRVDAGQFAITASGRDKSRLLEEDILLVDDNGDPLAGGQPSAETGLHMHLYRRDASIGAVIHTHSLNSVLAAMGAGNTISFQGLELLKAFNGIESHEAEWSIPVFENDQDIARLAGVVEEHMEIHGQGQAYLIRGHGLYTWGRDLGECMRHLEATEFLLDYYCHKQVRMTDE